MIRASALISIWLVALVSLVAAEPDVSARYYYPGLYRIEQFPRPVTGKLLTFLHFYYEKLTSSHAHSNTGSQSFTNHV